MAGEWTETTLGELADFVSGGTPSKSRPEFWTGPVPWVSAKDMKRFRLDDTEDHVSEEALESGARLVPAGTVFLLTRGMTLLNDVPICVARRPMTFNQDVKALRPKPHVASEYLPYVLLGNRERLLSQVDLAGHGTGRLNTDELKALDVGLPAFPEQRAIAHILGTLDDKIELNRRMSETLEAMARALFKSWFVDFDPVRAKAEGRDPGLPQPLAALFPARLVDSELGEIPEGWEVKPLDEVAHFQNGLALQKYRPTGGEDRLPAVKIAQLRSGRADSGEWATANLKPECIIDDGDVVFSWSGSLLVRVWTGGRAALNQHLFKVTSDRYPRWFFLDAILSHLPEFRRIAAGKATTMGHIQRHHLTSAACVVPDEGCLRGVSTLFAGLVDRSVANDVQCRTLGSLRDALLPKLISGELRVENPDRILGAHA